MEPKILIVTTLYNSSNTITATLNSFLNQTKNDNIIHYIYEDGSLNHCDHIIEEYIHRVNSLPSPYKVVYEICDHNLGVDKAHEYVFKKVINEYVFDILTWIDSGDYYSNDVIEKVTNAFIKDPSIGWLHTNYFEYFTDGSIAKKPISCRYTNHYLKRQFQLPNILFGFNFHYYGNFYFNKEQLLKLNPKLTIFLNTSHYDDQLILTAAMANLKYKYLHNARSYVYICENHAGAIKPINDKNHTNEYSFLNELDFFKPNYNFIEAIFQMKRDGMTLAEMKKNTAYEKKYKDAYKSFKSFFKKYKVKKTYHPYYWKYNIKYNIYKVFLFLCLK